MMKTYFKYFWQKVQTKFSMYLSSCEIIVSINWVFDVVLSTFDLKNFMFRATENIKRHRLFCPKVQRSKCNLQCLNFQCKPLIEFHKNNERNINKAHKNGALMKLPLLMVLLETACLQSTFIILPDNYFCNSWQGI